MTRCLALSTLVLCLAALPAAAQDDRPVTIDQVIDALTRAAVTTFESKLNAVPFSRTVETSAAGPVRHYVAGLIADKEAYKTLADLMAVSSATQIGSSSDTGGSTSVAMKGLVPAVLGFAVEHGAITQDVNDTVATFRVSPAGIFKALQGKGLLDIYHDYSTDTAFNIASRFSGSVSFDTSLGDSPGTLLADEQQLTAWSVSIMFLNRRDPRAKRYGTEWRALSKTSAQPLIDASAALDKALGTWTALTEWQTALAARVKTEVDDRLAADNDRRGAEARFKAILQSELAALADLPPADSSVKPAIDAYLAQLTTVVQAKNDIYAFANKGAIGTFDWTTTRDETLPDLYTLTGVFETSFTKSRKDDFTANAAWRFYREAPAGSDRQFKDFSLSAQWERPLGRFFEIPFNLAAAVRYQYIPEDIPVPASALIVPVTADETMTPPPAATTGMDTAVAPKGHLILGQGKLTIPLADGVRIPLSFTVANRTELIEEKDVRANFGVTFNLDAFAAAFKARR